jgi:hypothetical protein
MLREPIVKIADLSSLSVPAFWPMAKSAQLAVSGLAQSRAPDLRRTHRADIVKYFFSAGIGKDALLLQVLNLQHHGRRKRSPPALRANLRIMQLDQSCEYNPRHHDRHLGQNHIRLPAFIHGYKIEQRKTSSSIRAAPGVNNRLVPSLPKLFEASLHIRPLNLVSDLLNPVRFRDDEHWHVLLCFQGPSINSLF